MSDLPTPVPTPGTPTPTCLRADSVPLSAVDARALRDYLARARRLQGEQGHAVLLEMAGYLGAALDAAERRRDEQSGDVPPSRTSG